MHAPVSQSIICPYRVIEVLVGGPGISLENVIWWRVENQLVTRYRTVVPILHSPFSILQSIATLPTPLFCIVSFHGRRIGRLASHNRICWDQSGGPHKQEKTNN